MVNALQPLIKHCKVSENKIYYFNGFWVHYGKIKEKEFFISIHIKTFCRICVLFTVSSLIGSIYHCFRVPLLELQVNKENAFIGGKGQYFLK